MISIDDPILIQAILTKFESIPKRYPEAFGPFEGDSIDERIDFIVANINDIKAVPATKEILTASNLYHSIELPENIAHHVRIAKRLHAHDVGSVISGATNAIDPLTNPNYVEMIVENGRPKFQKPKNMAAVKQKAALDYLVGMHHAENFYITMAMLTAQDSSFVTEQSFSYSKEVLKRLKYTLKKTFDFPNAEDQTIDSSAYVAISQFIKNAKSDTISVTTGNDKNFTYWSVKDFGPGIRDKKGNPISPEILPTIFGDYSTKELGGLGLQVVKLISDIRGGHVAVKTNTPDYSLAYSTKTQSIEKLDPDSMPGTEFRIYLPKLT